MKRGLSLLCVLGAFLGCAGLAKDVTNGASQTEREIKGERKHTTPASDADAGAGGDDASISI